MNHFSRKNILNLQGGGGKKGGGAPPAPPPAELQPPKLGALQTLASYSYAEIIDLVGDGPIEGFVNKNGQYVQGNRIFESVYFDNTPVKKSFDLSYTGLNPVSASGYSLTGQTNALYSRWFSSGEFVPAPFTGIDLQVTTGSYSGNLASGLHPYILKENSYFANHSSVNDPYLAVEYAPVVHIGNSGNIFTCPDPYIRDKQCEITWSRADIAKSIYKGIDLLKTVSSSPATYGEDASNTAFQKLMRYNYNSWTEVRDKVLSYPVNLDEGDYPVFAVKFEIGSPYSDNTRSDCGNVLSSIDVDNKNISVSSDFTVTKYTNTVLFNDISNQVSQKIEVGDLQSANVVRPLQYIDLTYLKKSNSTTLDVGGSIFVFGFKNEDGDGPSEESLKAINDFVQSLYIVRPDNEKYNYNNVLVETRHGDEWQTPLSYFDKVYIDKEYGVKLPGPFDVTQQVFRVSNFGDDTGFRLQGVYEFPLAENTPSEGSSDSRSGKDFSSYAGNSRSQLIEEAVPITHIVENNNVEQVFVSVGIRALSDTNQIDTSLAGIGSIQAGSKIPSAMRFKIEIGILDPFGKEISSSIEERIYQVMGLVDSPALIDIGREEVSSVLNDYKFLRGTKANSEINASTAIILPASDGENKRFVRITRTTFETSSVLIRREMSLEKITEVINTKFSYSGSAIAGIKIDSRNMSAIPPRNYDLRLKRIMVPSNYFPLAPDGKDKRRYKTATEFNAATSSDLQIYNDNWDGTFKEAWSDNPAWVLFDILINEEYGLGSFIEPSQINIWELYKIGRFCDCVNKDGVFTGVENTYGGKEPRYAINVIMGDKINIFDTINAIASVFRGNIFYSNSFVDFSDDRIKVPIAEFSNVNVKEGTFSYTNSRKDEEFNVVEVSYLDENDEFKPKIEYVENSDDIRKRGILRTTVDSFGVTSKAMARRIGKHVLYATTNENQAVSFIAGNETLFVKPGDLISVNDELKTLQRNFGRTLGVFPEEKRVWINEKFSETYHLGEITLFAPTGKRTYQDLLNQARTSGGISFKDIYESDVPQIQTFKISGFDNGIDYGSNIYIKPQTVYPLISFTGEGYSGLYSGIGQISGYEQYTGIDSSTNGHKILKNTTQEYYYIAPQSAQAPNDLVFSFFDADVGSISLNIDGNLHSAEISGDSPQLLVDSLSNFFSTGLFFATHFNDNTLRIVNPSVGTSANSNVSSHNIATMVFSGGGYGVNAISESSGYSAAVNDFWTLETDSNIITSGSSGALYPYVGAWQSGGCVNRAKTDNPNIEFLNRVQNGSPFGITMSGIDREIYKVTSIRESNINEYEVAAIKFNTGKFAEIENTQNLDDFYSEFSFVPQAASIAPTSTDSQLYYLSSPEIIAFETGNYDSQGDSLDISGSWSAVNGATSYAVTLISPNGEKTTISTPSSGYVFNDQNQIGFYRLNLSAKNSPLGYSSRTVSSGINVFSSESTSTPYIKTITIG